MLVFWGVSFPTFSMYFTVSYAHAKATGWAWYVAPQPTWKRSRKRQMMVFQFDKSFWTWVGRQVLKYLWTPLCLPCLYARGIMIIEGENGTNKGNNDYCWKNLIFHCWFSLSGGFQLRNKDIWGVISPIFFHPFFPYKRSVGRPGGQALPSL